MDIRFDSKLRAEIQVGDITVRALSDNDVQERRKIALVESLETRSRLEDRESAEFHEAIVEPLADADEEVMRQAIIQFESAAAVEEASDLFPYDYIPFPDEATLQERHEVINRRREHEEAVDEARTKYVADRIDRLAGKVEEWDAETLRPEVERRIIENTVRAKYTEVYQYQTLVLSCFGKDGKPMFESWQAVRGYSNKLVQRLFSEYRNVDSVDPWELEKNALTGPTTD